MPPESTMIMTDPATARSTAAIAPVAAAAAPVAAATAPVAAIDRVQSVDVLRGVALLGILLVNILDFGLPLGAEHNPRIAGGSTGLNLAAWFAGHVLFDGKFRAIFSMLFGAGAVLLTSRAERRGGGIEVADMYYRRTLWLIAFGLLHAYFIWDGDILFTYGLFGLALFPLRSVKPAVLLVAGLVVLTPVTVGSLSEAQSIRSLRQKAFLADRAAAEGRALTEEQQEDRLAWRDELDELHRYPPAIAREYEDHHGSYWTMFVRRLDTVPGTQSSDLYHFGVFDTLSMMLIGMAFLRYGMFSATLRPRTYWRLAAFGYLTGIPLNIITGWFYYRSGFDPVYLMYNVAINEFGRLLLAIGHIAVVMLVVQAGVLGWLTPALAAVGQTALTNYIGTSIVCTLLFNGYGFDLFGRLSRAQLLIVVVAVWSVQLIVSSIWLRYFRFGPIEWLWRSLTYCRRQPMLKTASG
jgi:uncharacterized protein